MYHVYTPFLSDCTFPEITFYQMLGVFSCQKAHIL